MSLLASLHVEDVAPIGAPYIGAGSWGGWRASWRARYTRRGSWWTRSWSRATSGTLERRRNPSEIRTWAGRQKRARRTVLAGWDRQARQRARERGRSAAGWAPR